MSSVDGSWVGLVERQRTAMLVTRNALLSVTGKVAHLISCSDDPTDIEDGKVGVDDTI